MRGERYRGPNCFCSWEECNWDGDPRRAQELFSATSASSSTTGTNVAVNTNACLAGCLVQGISPFDDDGLAVWNNRGTCDSTTIGCEVSALNYPSTFFQGALWASSWGTSGSTSCTCSICDPYPWSVTTSYMSQDTSLWSRIQCYLVATEASGYDVSPCVAAIVDTGTLPCVDDVYEPPTMTQFDCDENGIRDFSESESYEECSWAGEYRSTDELYGGTRAPSTAPAPSNTRLVAPQPGVSSTDSSGLAPAAPSVTSPSSAGGSTPPLETEEGVPCAVGITCQDGFCCHPDTNTCGRKYTFCQERDFSDGPRCCSGVDGDPSESNVCSEDSICEEPGGRSTTEVIELWIGIVSGSIGICGCMWAMCKCCG